MLSVCALRYSPGSLSRPFAAFHFNCMRHMALEANGAKQVFFRCLWIGVCACSWLPLKMAIRAPKLAAKNWKLTHVGMSLQLCRVDEQLKVYLPFPISILSISRHVEFAIATHSSITLNIRFSHSDEKKTLWLCIDLYLLIFTFVSPQLVIACFKKNLSDVYG